jgi:hypothetical protein
MIVTTWNIVPDYDEWGSDTSWDCNNWVQWHKELKKKFGVDKAKLIWEYAYAKGSNFSSHWDCRSFNSQFRSYINGEDLDPYANLGALALLIKPLGLGTDIIKGGTDVVSGAADFVGSLGQNAKPILTIALIGVAGFFVYKAYKSI